MPEETRCLVPPSFNSEASTTNITTDELSIKFLESGDNLI